MMTTMTICQEKILHPDNMRDEMKIYQNLSEGLEKGF